jgi:hypothetical protein
MNPRRIPLKKRFRLASAVAATSAVLVSAPYASAATGQAQPKPVVTHVKTIASFDFAVGAAPENVTLNPDGSVTVSTLGGSAGRRPALVRVDVSGHREGEARSGSRPGPTSLLQDSGRPSGLDVTQREGDAEGAPATSN